MATPPQSSVPSTESSVALLQRVQQGDERALEQLCARYLPRLRRWASGRLPRFARDLHETEDVVQESVVASLRNLGTFEPRHDGALQAYMRRAVMNRIRDLIRQAQRRPRSVEMRESEVDPGLSPLEAAIGREELARYESAMLRLREEERELIHLRIELGHTYAEIASASGKGSADAARMAVTRALARLAQEMGREQRG